MLELLNMLFKVQEIKEKVASVNIIRFGMIYINLQVYFS